MTTEPTADDTSIIECYRQAAQDYVDSRDEPPSHAELMHRLRESNVGCSSEKEFDDLKQYIADAVTTVLKAEKA